MYPLASLTSLQSLNLGGPSDTSGRLVLMEKGRRRKDPLLDRAEGRFALCFRRPLEKLEGTGHRGVVTHLTIITGEPNELVAHIHTRMPVILAEEHHEAWLSNQAGKEVLVPFPADTMRAWPISPRVNSPKNNDPDLIRPL